MRHHAGFTLIETLVALVVAAVLLSILSRTMSSVIVSSDVLRKKSVQHNVGLNLRRLIHRDIAGMQGPDSLEFHSDGFSMRTAHNHLAAAPMDVTIRWRFSPDGVIREEEEAELQYEFSQTLFENLVSWELEIHQSSLGRWLSLDSVILATASDNRWSEDVTGLRLTLNTDEIETRRAGENEWSLVEYVPHVPEPAP